MATLARYVGNSLSNFALLDASTATSAMDKHYLAVSRRNSDACLTNLLYQSDSQLPYIDRSLANHQLYNVSEPVISALAVLNATIGDDGGYAGMLKLARLRDAAAIFGRQSARDLFVQLLAIEMTGSVGSRSGRLGFAIQYLAAQQQALHLVARYGKEAFTLERLCDVHLILTSHIAVNGERGSMRSPNDPAMRAGQSGPGARPADPLPYMADVLDFIHDAPALPLVLRAGLLYLQVCAISPFGYGNEEMAMLMVQMLLTLEGYPPISCSRLVHRMNAQRSAAIHALREREGVTEGLTLFLSDLLEGITGLTAELTHAQQMCKRWTLALGNTRRDAAVRQIVPSLLAQPLVTVSSVQRAFDLPFPTASGGLTALVNLKILTVMEVDGVATRSRMFCAKELTDFSFDPETVRNGAEARPALGAW